MGFPLFFGGKPYFFLAFSKVSFDEIEGKVKSSNIQFGFDSICYLLFSF